MLFLLSIFDMHFPECLNQLPELHLNNILAYMS